MVDLLVKQEGILLNAASEEGVTALYVASAVSIFDYSNLIMYVCKA